MRYADAAAIANAAAMATASMTRKALRMTPPPRFLAGGAAATAAAAGAGALASATGAPFSAAGVAGILPQHVGDSLLPTKSSTSCGYTPRAWSLSKPQLI